MLLFESMSIGPLDLNLERLKPSRLLAFYSKESSRSNRPESSAIDSSSRFGESSLLSKVSLLILLPALMRVPSLGNFGSLLYLEVLYRSKDPLA